MWYIHEYSNRVMLGSLFFRELKKLLHLLNTERASNRFWSRQNTERIAADSETSLIWPSSKVSQVQLRERTRGEQESRVRDRHMWLGHVSWSHATGVSSPPVFALSLNLPNLKHSRDWPTKAKQTSNSTRLCLLNQFCMLSQSQWHSSGWLPIHSEAGLPVIASVQ